MIAIVIVLVPLVAGVISLQQQRLYSASSEVVISRVNLANSLTNTQDASAVSTNAEITTTDAQVASTLAVARLAARTANIPGVTPRYLLAHASVTPSQVSDILTFTVTDPNSSDAVKLARDYATAYTLYQTRLDTRALSQATAGLTRRIRNLEHGRPVQPGAPAEARGSPAQARLLQSLISKQQQIATLAALQGSGSQVVSAPSAATLTQPRTLRNVVIAFILGIVLALLLAYVRHALDTRVHTMDEVSESLDLFLLARIPSPPGWLRRAGSEPGLFASPVEPHAESFRMLRTAMDFARMRTPADVVLVTSAIEGEGKSTTVANLAIAEARAGRRVIAVDLDLRRPALHKFFDAWRDPGVTNVLANVARASALRRVDAPEIVHASATAAPQPTASSSTAELETPLGDAANGERRPESPAAPWSSSSNGSTSLVWRDELDATLIDIPDRVDRFVPFRGSLHILPAGAVATDTVELSELAYIGPLIAELRQRADLVLIDTPPLLRVGDAMAISEHIDAMLVVVRLEFMRRPMLVEVRRLLDSSPAKAIGCVLTGAEHDDQYTYGPSGYYYGTAHET